MTVNALFILAVAKLFMDREPEPDRHRAGAQQPWEMRTRAAANPLQRAGFWVAIPGYRAGLRVAIPSLVAGLWVAIPVRAACFWVAIPSLVASFWVAIPLCAAGFWVAIPSLVAGLWPTLREYAQAFVLSGEDWDLPTIETPRMRKLRHLRSVELRLLTGYLPKGERASRVMAR